MSEYYEPKHNSKRLPPTNEMFQNLLGGIKIIIDEGLESRSVESREKNLKICSDCEFYIKESERCGKCGCFLKLKVKLKSWKCPLNKWAN